MASMDAFSELPTSFTTVGLTATLQGLALLYMIGVFSPILFSTMVVIRQRKIMKRRLLFIATATALTYGCLLFVWLALWTPLETLGIYVFPSWKELGYFEAFPPLQWLATSMDFVMRCAEPGMAAVTGVLGWGVVHRLARRWNRLVGACEEQVGAP